MAETSSYSEVQAQWNLDLEPHPCPRCEGRGERLETFCLICQETVDGCGCTDADLEQFLLATCLGAA